MVDADATAPVGIVFGSLTPPEHLAGGSRLAESLGFADLWFSEDCFFTGAMSGMAQMLASTRDIPVGLGLASTQTRHPALLAMELAGLARMHPGRIRATVGLGNAHWLRQMGIMPARPLSAVLEDLAALRSLLNGETVTAAGNAGHTFEGVTLSFPPAVVPPLLMGAVNERALRAAGAHADGVLLSVLAGPQYVSWAAAHVHAGAASVGRAAPPITAFVLASVDDRQDRAQSAVADAVQFFARAELETALVRESATPHRDAILAEPWDAAVRSRLVGEFAAAGSAEQVASKLQSLLDHGADAVALWVFPSDDLDDQLHRLAEGVLPRIRQRSAAG
jgi:alkanesulfonate monooxygenase SsuD/methylene tetrahydromethanopterin reductase-like flavin-dependent oxidoreductase (luciferase family)